MVCGKLQMNALAFVLRVDDDLNPQGATKRAKQQKIKKYGKRMNWNGFLCLSSSQPMIFMWL